MAENSFLSIRERLKGIIPFVPTPYLKSNKAANLTILDEEGLRKNLQYLLKYDFSVITPTAGTGEIFTLTNEEYFRILEIVREEIGERFLVMPGLPQETERAIYAAQRAQELGYQCLLSFPPPTLSLSEEGLYRHWEAIANSVDIAIIVFRAPWLPFRLELLDRLAHIPNIISVKEETNDLLWFRQANLKMGKRFVFIGGGELQFPYYLMSGATAITTGLPNFMPEIFFDMYTKALKNDYQQVIKLHEQLLPLLQLRQKPGNAVPLLKYGLDLVGLHGGINRLPQVALSAEDAKLTRDYLKKLQVI